MMLNDDVLPRSRFEPREYQESVVAAALLFEVGLYVEKDVQVARKLLSSLDDEQRHVALGGVFIEAAEERALKVALRCIDHGVTFTSTDRRGRVAYTAALKPGLENVLDRLLRVASNPEQVRHLRNLASPVGERSRRLRAQMSAAGVRIVAHHLATLSEEPTVPTGR